MLGKPQQQSVVITVIGFVEAGEETEYKRSVCISQDGEEFLLPGEV